MLNIIVKTKFSAIHSWPDCDIAEVDYLKNPHRHEFYVTMKAHVNHDNRYIEFIQLKNKINQFLRNNWEERNIGRLSCEMIAQKLLQEFPVCFYAKVMEDNENGSELIKNENSSLQKSFV